MLVISDCSVPSAATSPSRAAVVPAEGTTSELTTEVQASPPEEQTTRCGERSEPKPPR